MRNTKLNVLGRWTLATLGILALAYGGLWFLLGQNLRDLSQDWITAQQRAGWAIAISDVRLTGFPTWPRVVVDTINITAPPEEGSWSWATEQVTLIPNAIDLKGFTVQAPGRHELSAPWSGGARWALEAARADFDFELDADERLKHGRVHLGDAEVTDPNALPLVGATRLDLALSLAPDNDAAPNTFARFTGAADAVRLAITLPPFERVIRSAQLDADLVGDIQPGRLSEALDAWRQGGGTLEVRKMRLDWPPLALYGDGTVALDERLQPIAAFTTHITGFDDTLRALETQGIIPRGQAASAMVILNLLTSTPKGTDTPELTLPVSVQDQRLSVGPFNVLDVPEVVWE